MNRKYKHIFLIGDGLKKREHDILACTQLNDYDGVRAALQENPANILKKDHDDMDALHWAVCKNNIAIAELLLRFEGKRNVVESHPNISEQPKNPANTTNSEVFKIDLSRKDAFGRGYAQIALTKGNPEMIKLLTTFQFPEAFDENSDWNKNESPDTPSPRRPKGPTFKPDI